MSDNHIRPEWLKVAAYLQHESRKTQGFAILSGLKILIDGNGNPIQWTEIDMTKLMPKAQCQDVFPKLMMLDKDG